MVNFRFHIVTSGGVDVPTGLFLQQDLTARNLPVNRLRSCAVVFRYRSMCVRGQAGVLG